MTALAQRPQQGRPDRRIVLDEQQVGHARTVAARTGASGGLNPPLACPGGSLSVRPGIVDGMERRALLVAAGWLGAAVLAVLVGLGALDVIGDGLTSQSTPVLSTAEVDRQLRQQSPAAAASPTASPAPSVSSALGTEPVAKATRGGTVVVRCAGSRAEIVSMAPAQGFAVHEKDRGLQDEAEGEFRGSADEHDRVKVSVTCTAGVAQVSTRSERDDD